MALPTQEAPRVLAVPGQRAPVATRPRRRRGVERHRSAYVLVAPAVFLLVLFLVVPVLLAFGLSFTNARLISPNPPRFVGLDNFTRALVDDPVFTRSLINTFVFAAVVVPVQAALGLLLALLVNQKVRGVTAFRVVYFVPVVTSIVVVSILWKFMYQEQGLVNATINSLTFGAWDGTAWLNNTSTALPAIIVMSVWQAVGFHMIIWLSGLQTIPAELYEAASMDGANKLQQFLNVTWPGLRSTAVFILVTITIACLGLFSQIVVMTQGGPINATSTIVYHAYRTGYQQQQVGYGAALSLIFFVLVLAVAMVQRRLTREKD